MGVKTGVVIAVPLIAQAGSAGMMVVEGVAVCATTITPVLMKPVMTVIVYSLQIIISAMTMIPALSMIVATMVRALAPQKNCDDNNICTQDSCDSQNGMCVHTPLNSIPCNDGNKCTVNDSCTNGVCQGTFISCDDNNPCTNDTCDPVRGCVFIPNTNPCDDGNACTTGDKCVNGTCKGTPVSCNDNNPCTNDTCDPVRGCVFTPVDGNLCDDGNACTTGDKCVNGTCKGTPISCDDNNPCTDDTCDPVRGCVFIPNTKTCDDGDACTQGDVCTNGKCQGTPISCNDNNVCTDDFCDPSTGCYHTPVPNCQNP